MGGSLATSCAVRKVSGGSLSADLGLWGPEPAAGSLIPRVEADTSSPLPSPHTNRIWVCCPCVAATPATGLIWWQVAYSPPHANVPLCRTVMHIVGLPIHRFPIILALLDAWA